MTTGLSNFRKAVVICSVGIIFLIVGYLLTVQKSHAPLVTERWFVTKPTRIASAISFNVTNGTQPTSIDNTSGSVSHFDGDDAVVKVLELKGEDTKQPTTQVPFEIHADMHGSENLLISESGTCSKMEIGTVNYDVWRWMSGYLVDDMRLWWSFPKYPEESRNLTTLKVSYSERTGESNFRGKYAHKLYGYLLPPETGSYRFQIAMTNVSCGCEVELWLSFSNDPMQIMNILFLEHRYASQYSSVLNAFSEPIKLFSNHSYYFEVLEKAFDGGTVVEIKWSNQGLEEFVQIPSSSIARTASLSAEVRKLGDDLPSSKLQRHSRVPQVMNYFDPVTTLNILPSCKFKAHYAYKHFVSKYGGVGEVLYSRVYPFDGSNIPDNFNGESQVIDQDLVDRVLQLYGKGLKKRYLHAAHKLIHMEQTEDANQGSRFLLEMELNITEQDSLVYTSQYVYLQANSNQLCATSNFKWNPHAQVYLVVAIKDVGNWAHQLLYNVEQIYAATKDTNFDLVFVDFESTDINLPETIQSSSFKRCHHIPLQGRFSRAGGLQAALQYITDYDSIVITMDVHLYVPVGFINSVRKHVIRGKMAYAPVLVRLGKGFSEVNINGFWEVLGYGIYGMYRSDWEAIGGFSTDEYKFNWGGEDWDIVDKAAGYGLETFRLRYPGFVHYFHTYGELWGNQNN